MHAAAWMHRDLSAKNVSGSEPRTHRVRRSTVPSVRRSTVPSVRGVQPRGHGCTVHAAGDDRQLGLREAHRLARVCGGNRFKAELLRRRLHATL